MSSPEEDPVPRTLRRANDAAGTRNITKPAALFGEFWREGELALLFGAAGAGKSLLAVQIAESLARGRDADHEDGPRKPQAVLYVDLVLSDGQFALRYSRETRGGGRRVFKFSARLYRDRPAEGERLADWLRSCVVEQKISVVVIDDLSVVTRSDDGTRETFELVRELRKMTRELGVSILVLADSLAPVFQRDVAERDLRRSRILCAYADSVFAIEAAVEGGRRDLVQTRSQAASLVWTRRRPAQFMLEQRDDGFIELEPYRPDLTEEEREMVIRINAMHAAKRSYREIARELKISKSRAARLHSRWTPQLEQHDEADDWDDEYEDDWEPPQESYPGEFTDRAMVYMGLRPVMSEPPASAGGQIDGFDAPGGQPHSPTNWPPAHAGGSDLVDAPGEPPHSPTNWPPANAGGSDLERSTDAYGREIHIESRDERTGKPIIWYQTDQKGNTRRYRRKLFGIQVERVDEIQVGLPP